MNPENYLDEPEMTPQEQAAWSKIDRSLRSVKLVAPNLGFASRWLAVEQKRSIAESKRREVWLALGNSAAILLILGAIVIVLWSFFRQSYNLTGLVAYIIKSLTDIVVAVRLWISSHQSFSLFAWLGTGWIYVVILSAISLLAVLLTANIGESSPALEEISISD